MFRILNLDGKHLITIYRVERKTIYHDVLLDILEGQIEESNCMNYK